MASKKKQEPRSDEDFTKLDTAIGGVMDFEQEITWMLARKGINPSAYHQTLDAMRELHDGDLNNAPRT